MSTFLEQIDNFEKGYEECSRFYAQNENNEIILDLEKCKLHIQTLKDDMEIIQSIFNIQSFNKELLNNTEAIKKTLDLIRKIKSLLEKLTKAQNKFLLTTIIFKNNYSKKIE